MPILPGVFERMKGAFHLSRLLQVVLVLALFTLMYLAGNGLGLPSNLSVFHDRINPAHLESSIRTGQTKLTKYSPAPYLILYPFFRLFVHERGHEEYAQVDLGLIHELSGEFIRFQRILNGIIATLVLLMIYLLARGELNHRDAVLSMLIAGIMPSLAFAAHNETLNALAIFCAVATATSLAWAVKTDRWLYWSLSGIALGMAVAVKETQAALALGVPFIFVLVWLGEMKATKKVSSRFALVVVLSFVSFTVVNLIPFNPKLYFEHLRFMLFPQEGADLRVAEGWKTFPLAIKGGLEDIVSEIGLVFFVLAVYGAFKSWRKILGKVLLPVILCFFFFVVLSMPFIGRGEGAENRHVVVAALLMSPFSVIGFRRLAVKNKKWKLISSMVFVGSLAVGYIALLLFCANFIWNTRNDLVTDMHDPKRKVLVIGQEYLGHTPSLMGSDWFQPGDNGYSLNDEGLISFIVYTDDVKNEYGVKPWLKFEQLRSLGGKFSYAGYYSVPFLLSAFDHYGVNQNWCLYARNKR